MKRVESFEKIKRVMQVKDNPVSCEAIGILPAQNRDCGFSDMTNIQESRLHFIEDQSLVLVCFPRHRLLCTFNSHQCHHQICQSLKGMFSSVDHILIFGGLSHLIGKDRELWTSPSESWQDNSILIDVVQ